MPAAFASSQTFIQMRILETVEALGDVEVELIAPDAVLQFQEALHQLNLRPGVFNQSVAVDDVELPAGKHVQPAAEELGVQRYVQRPVLRVHLARLQQRHVLPAQKNRTFFIGTLLKILWRMRAGSLIHDIRFERR